MDFYDCNKNLCGNAKYSADTSRKLNGRKRKKYVFFMRFWVFCKFNLKY